MASGILDWYAFTYCTEVTIYDTHERFDLPKVGDILDATKDDRPVELLVDSILITGKKDIWLDCYLLNNGSYDKENDKLWRVGIRQIISGDVKITDKRYKEPKKKKKSKKR